MIVIKVILWVLLAVILIVFLALAIPVRADLIYGTSEVKLIVKYLFLKFPIDLGGEEKEDDEMIPPEKSEKPSENETKKNRNDPGEKQSLSKDRASENKKTPERDKDKNRKNKDDKKDSKEKKENKILSWAKKTFKEKGLSGLVNAVKEIAKLAVSFLKPIFKHLKIKDLDMDIVVAFEDAADTAVKYGYACAGIYPSLAVLLKIMKYKKYSVNIRPDFDKKSPEINVFLELTLVPWFVVFGAVHALVDFLILRAKGEL